MATIRRRVEREAAAPMSAEAEARLDALTPAEIEDDARADPDNPPLTGEEMARGLFGRRVRRAHERLGITQAEFAARFSVNLRRLQDWEQGRFAPDSVTLASI